MIAVIKYLPSDLKEAPNCWRLRFRRVVADYSTR